MVTPIEKVYRAATVDYMDGPGDRIRRLRKGKGIRQVDLAAAAGIDQSSLSMIENGGGMTAQTLMQICARLEAAPKFILYGVGKEDEPGSVLWPFPKVPYEHWEALDEADKGYVQRVLLEAIQRCQTAVPAAPDTSYRQPLTTGVLKATRKRA